MQEPAFIEIHDAALDDAAMATDMRPRLTAALEKSGLKQVELAKLTGFSTQRLNNYFKRGNSMDAETLAKLASALNVSADYLLGLSEPKDVAVEPLVRRFLELEGLPDERAALIAQGVREALAIASSLGDEGSAALRSRLAAQTVWQLRAGPKPTQ